MIQSNDKIKLIKLSIDDFVKASIELAHSMLVLLPPLIPTRPQWYNDNIQETNRRTWDESLCQDDDVDDAQRFHLIYYRPVLVHGSQLHVAVKGLVGNRDTA